MHYVTLGTPCDRTHHYIFSNRSSINVVLILRRKRSTWLNFFSPFRFHLDIFPVFGMPPRKRAATQRSPARGIGKKRNRRTPVQLRERSPPRTATSWTDRQAPAEGQSQPPEEAPQFPMDSTPDNPVGPFSKTCTRGRPVAYTTTSPHMGLIEQETSRLLDRSLAHNTHLAYNTALTKFKQFTLLYGFTSTWPVPVDQLLHYIAYLSLNQLTYRTICLHLSAIAYQHKIQGFQDTTKAFIITKALEGVKRSVGVNQDIRLPISYQLFVKIIHALTSVCRSPFESCLFSAAFSLAFYGLLKVSEIFVIAEFTSFSKPARSSVNNFT
ncbi:uncharacterized protein LOC130050307 isoform X1 [Ostrea edulis]|uniref:uncharacterized protein LOC130050307 isoform X1 n=1 Tax=Ostrea edulis TaxID=37623 RepID=UPI0024AE947A|nr:uncharacterized protein LOC130050307 isoform X1 [Ostrea edulis]